MASREQVRAYLAHWFQLGKPVVFSTDHTRALPQPVFGAQGYSDAFERCWQQIEERHGGNAYLQGCDQTVKDLLSPLWEITACARCPMPIPMPVGAVALSPCPCHDLPLWPNSSIPMPRSQVDSGAHLSAICDRLQAPRPMPRQGLESAYQQSVDLPNVAPHSPPNVTQPAQKASQKTPYKATKADCS